MPVVDASDIGRTYGVRVVLAGASLTLDRGDRLGLVGVNGSGKSTLARILARVEEPDHGSLVYERGARVGYLPQEPIFEGDPTALEAVLGGLSAWSEAKQRYDRATQALEQGGGLKQRLAQQAEAAAEIERLGGWNRAHDAAALLSRLGVVDTAQRVSEMSGGERRRVDLARFLVSRPDLAILDEPTNHLDVETIEWLETHLVQDQPGALLLITHDRYFLDRVVKRTAELSNGALTIYDGGYEAYLSAKAEREAQEARVERNRQNLLRRELAWMRRGPPARTTKQKARIKRAEEVIRTEGPRKDKTVSLAVEASRSGRVMLDLRDVSLGYEGNPPLVRDLTLSLTRGERLGIIGPNGAGKTTLLRTILGQHAPSHGTVTLAKNTKATYFGQNREGLDPEATVLDNVAGGRARVTVGDRTMDTRGYLERFLFEHETQRQPVKSLSGGEKARALLAKLLLIPTNLLVLDEPTNDLDVATLGALESMILEMEATAVVVTHDRWFLDRVATGILVFEGDGAVVRYAGGYSDLKERRAARAKEDASASAPAARTESKGGKPGRPAGKKLTYGERLELDGILDAIAASEAEVEELEAKLADPAIYQGGGDEAPPLIAALEAARATLDAQMARWEHLETKKSESVS